MLVYLFAIDGNSALHYIKENSLVNRNVEINCTTFIYIKRSQVDITAGPAKQKIEVYPVTIRDKKVYLEMEKV